MTKFNPVANRQPLCQHTGRSDLHQGVTSQLQPCATVKLRWDSDLILVWLLLESQWHIAYRTHSYEEHSAGSAPNRHRAGSITSTSSSSPGARNLHVGPGTDISHLRCAWRRFCAAAARREQPELQGDPAPGAPCSAPATFPEPQPSRSEHHFPGRSHPPALWHSLANGQGKAAGSC